MKNASLYASVSAEAESSGLGGCVQKNNEENMKKTPIPLDKSSPACYNLKAVGSRLAGVVQW